MIKLQHWKQLKSVSDGNVVSTWCPVLDDSNATNVDEYTVLHRPKSHNKPGYFDLYLTFKTTDNPLYRIKDRVLYKNRAFIIQSVEKTMNYELTGYINVIAVDSTNV